MSLGYQSAADSLTIIMLFSSLIFFISSLYLTSCCLSTSSTQSEKNCQSCHQIDSLNQTTTLNSAEKSPPKVQVKVYYETLCSDTRSFILHQLYPVWQELGHEGIMEIQWKPYGKATVSKMFVFLKSFSKFKNLLICSFHCISQWLNTKHEPPNFSWCFLLLSKF